MITRILVSALVLSLLGIEIALACRCAPTESRGQAYETSDQVFAGKVLSMRRVPDDEPSFYPLEVTLLLGENFKGRSCDTMVLYTGLGGPDCGFPFELDSSYVIYANWMPEPWPCSGRMGQALLVTTRCHRTMARSEEEIEALRIGYRTFPKESRDPE